MQVFFILFSVHFAVYQYINSKCLYRTHVNLISQRTKEALARKKAEGVQLGRPSGKLSAQDTYKLYPKEKQIMKLRAKGVSFVKIGKILKVNRDTVRRYYHTFMEEKTQVAHTNL